MQVESRVARSLLACALVLVSAALDAFEPGKARVCEASADGERFECRDKNPAPAAPSREAGPAAPVRPAEDRPEADSRIDNVPAAASAPAPQSAERDSAPVTAMRSGSARAVPNYLLQKPSPAIAAPTAVAEPTVTAAPAAVHTAPASAAAAAPIASQPAAPIRAQTDVVAERASQSPLASSAPMVGAHMGVSEFRRLPPNRYTLEIARAPTEFELAPLIGALAGIDGPLYLVALRAPDGEAYSLLWSDFTTIEAARDARATLPADVAITSGWPRRIGPLQTELVGP